jgi:hypothetical protein
LADFLLNALLAAKFGIKSVSGLLTKIIVFRLNSATETIYERTAIFKFCNNNISHKSGASMNFVPEKVAKNSKIIYY